MNGATAAPRIDLQGSDTAEPVATELSGLNVVDETTFTVKLTGPFAIFPLTLGYTAFDPLPEAFYADPDAYGARPIDLLLMTIR